MSREYTIKLSEEDIKILEEWYDTAELDREEDNDCDYDLILRIREAKQKPYTNFDKIKDEMTIDKLQRHCSPAVLQHISSMSEDYRKICADKYKNDKKGCNSEINCEECCKKWLESEVKE